MDVISKRLYVSKGPGMGKSQIQPKNGATDRADFSPPMPNADSLLPTGFLEGVQGTELVVDPRQVLDKTVTNGIPCPILDIRQ